MKRLFAPFLLEIVDGLGTGAAQGLTARDVDAAMPAVSPDGTRVAFASLRLRGGGIFVLTLATKAVTRLTAGVGDVDPAWTPDGSQVVFARRLRAGGHQLMVVSSSGGAPTAIPNALGRRPDVSPDGTRVVYERDGARTGLVVTSIDGRASTALGAGAQPSWSPAGTLIAFALRVGRLDHLYVVAPTGKGRRDITRFAPESDPSWSPDGNRLVVVTVTAAGTCCGLATVDTNGNDRVRITHGLFFASSPTWAAATP
jgi:TolB protein